MIKKPENLTKTRDLAHCGLDKSGVHWARPYIVLLSVPKIEKNYAIIRFYEEF